MAAKKEILFSLTKKDFVIEYFNGTGAGGQKRNKCAMACRIHHPASGTSATCQEERSQKENRERAFKRLVGNTHFQKWLKLEIAKQAGLLKNIEERVEKEMKNVKIEVRDGYGKFVEVTENHFKKLEEENA